jgi:hypothetical protein
MPFGFLFSLSPPHNGMINGQQQLAHGSQRKLSAHNVFRIFFTKIHKRFSGGEYKASV